MPDPVYVLGGIQTDFAKKWGDDSSDPLYAMMEDAVLGALDAASVDPEEIETAHVGNFVADRFTGQSHLGAVIPMLHPSWTSLPSSRHEGACASGSLAVLAAMADLEAGRYDVALVVGVELMRNVPGSDAAHHLGCAAWADTETSSDVLPWPQLFDRIATEVEARYGLDRDVLSRIAELNRDNAKRNPLAQTRAWSDGPEQFSRTDATANPAVVGETLASDCGRITDGAAAVVLASSRFLERERDRYTGSGPAPSLVAGWGHRTAPLPLERKFELSRDSKYLFPNVRDAVEDAYRRAQVSVGDLDVVELHDCFTITEYVLLDHLGITDPGQAWTAIEDERIGFDGALPVNPSGGLIGAGHPVGATGVRMLLDGHRQVTGTAGDYQVPGARTAATLNIGGSASTAVSFVVATARP